MIFINHHLTTYFKSISFFTLHLLIYKEFFQKLSKSYLLVRMEQIHEVLVYNKNSIIFYIFIYILYHLYKLDELEELLNKLHRYIHQVVFHKVNNMLMPLTNL